MSPAKLKEGLKHAKRWSGKLVGGMRRSFSSQEDLRRENSRKVEYLCREGRRLNATCDSAGAVAAFRGHPDVAIGNVVGSNVFNLLGVGGVAALVATLPVADQIQRFDIWVMLLATVMLLPILLGKMRLTRGLAGFYTALYLGYIAVQVYGVEKLLGTVLG